MNFKKFHHDGNLILVNLDNVTDIQTISTEDKCLIYFIGEQAQIKVDETIEQIQKLVECGEQ